MVAISPDTQKVGSVRDFDATFVLVCLHILSEVYSIEGCGVYMVYRFEHAF